MKPLKTNIRLTPHFTMGEMIKSQTATRLGLDNTPDAAAFENLRHLCANILEPVRARFNQPFSPSSGYRSPGLNATIGGSSKSQHMTGQAADIEIPGISNLCLAYWIRDYLQFDQLILEHYSPDDPHSGWVHVSYSRDHNRNECLTYNRKHGYLNGLIETPEQIKQTETRKQK